MANDLFVLTGQEEEQTPYDWDGMPEFIQKDKEAYAVINVRIRNEEDLRKFAALMEQPAINNKTKSMWYPILDRHEASLHRWIDEDDA